MVALNSALSHVAEPGELQVFLVFTRAEWERVTAPVRPEGRAFINGEFVAARDGRVFEKKTPGA